MAFTFQGWSSANWRRLTFKATKHQQNDRECWKNSRTHPWRQSLNNPWARRRRWDQLWSFSGDLNTKSEHEPHEPSSWQRARPHIPEKHRVCD
jgi:hypothetical protein